MGQVQSRQDEAFFKLDPKDKVTLLKKYTDLATSANGGKVLETTDELFGEGFHLIKSGPAVEDKNRETANGFWKDGWETRRHNKETHHTAIVQLACAGTIAGFDIDTSFFDGSHPAFASIEGCLVVEGVTGEKYDWKEILPKVALNGNSHHYYGLQANETVYTHIRLNMYPDGGIARLRVFGNVSPIFPDEKTVFDLACLASGARVIKTSDDRYGKPENIILPVAGINTRDGWQTRRSRVDGHHDWVEIKLGDYGMLESLEVDTTHFRGNNPDFISLDACKSEYRDVKYDPEVKWTSLLAKVEVEGDKKNIYTLEATGEAYSHVRLNIFPDGGISRLRVYGVRAPEYSQFEGIQAIEEQIEAVEELKVVESLLEAPTSTTTVVEEVEVSENAGLNKTVLMSEVSSVTTLVTDEESVVVEKETKKPAAKRGRAKAAGNVAVAAAKLAKPTKKTKGRSASVLDEDEEVSEPLTASPRKKTRE